MYREEAHSTDLFIDDCIHDGKQEFQISSAKVHLLINEIYDDLKSDNCKECIHGEMRINTYWCDLMKLNFPISFGCNRFKRSDDARG